MKGATTTVDPVQVLLVDGRPQDVERVCALLAESQISPDVEEQRFAIEVQGTLEAAQACLRDGDFDVILLELSLPDSDGMATLRDVLAEEPGAPVIVLTRLDTHGAGTASLQLGAQDHLDKRQLGRRELLRSIRYSMERFELVQTIAERTGALQISEARSRRIIERAADAIVVCDGHGTVLFRNPAACALFGRSRNGLEATSFMLPPEGSTAEMEIARGDGLTAHVELRVVGIEWYGQPAKLATLRDITQHKELLRELDLTRRRELAMRDEFLSHVSHELRTPLTVIQQYVSLMLDGLDGEFTEEQSRHLNAIMRSSRQLGELIEDLLEVTRADAGKLTIAPTNVAVGPVIDEALAAVRPMTADGRLACEVELSAALPPIHADPGRVRQVLVNLLGNAIKYAGHDVRLQISVAPCKHHEGFVTFTVADDGPGIPPDERESVFGHFYQMGNADDDHRSGLGLGLYISRKLIEQQGGAIWAEDSPLGGAALCFRLPVYSVSRLVSRLAGCREARRNLHLICLTLRGAKGGALAGFQHKYVQQLQGLAAGCVMADRDLVLPGQVSDEGTGLVMILVSTDADGARALTDRISTQFGAGIRFRGKGLVLSSQHVDLPVAPYAGLEDADWAVVVGGCFEEAAAELNGAPETAPSPRGEKISH